MSQIRVKVNHSRVGYLNEKLYIARPIRYTRIHTDELIRYASENCQLSQGTLLAAFCAIEDAMCSLLCNGHSVEYGSIGTFRHSFSSKGAKEREELTANSITRRRIVYTPSKSIKRQLAQIEYTGL
jgi:predicted histone-like DNA-binding protein